MHNILESTDITVEEMRDHPERLVDLILANNDHSLMLERDADVIRITVLKRYTQHTRRIVAEARKAWPHIPVYARARDGEHARRLHAAGAALASPDSIEAALQLGEALLSGVGVPDDVSRRIIDERRETEVAKALYRGA